MLLSVDDLEGLELTLEILADQESLAAITDSLAEIESGRTGVTVAQLRTNLQQRQASGG